MHGLTIRSVEYVLLLSLNAALAETVFIVAISPPQLQSIIGQIRENARADCQDVKRGCLRGTDPSEHVLTSIWR